MDSLVSQDAVSELRCPKCSSTNVSCHITRKTHTHTCHDCDHQLVAAR